MIKLYNHGVYLAKGRLFDSLDELQAYTGLAVHDPAGHELCGEEAKQQAAKGTMTYCIVQAHNESGDDRRLRLRFDSLTSHDITYVGIIQTARASGLTEFPIPYVLTNCHNSLCAVGGTINEDDHKFALSAARRFGGIYVPANMGNIHSINRELMAGCGKMILGSDSHTRYGALGCMGVGEGGGELAKQLLKRTYDFNYPEVIAIYLTGAPRPGVGPHDVALSIVGAAYKNGYVKNKVMEFVGPGIASLPIEYRNAIDVMTTETTCWSSIWETDGETRSFLEKHGRGDEYREIRPADTAYYDGCVYVDLSTVECTIAMPMHPSNTYTIQELKENAADILHETEIAMNAQIRGASFDLMSKLRPDGSILVDQGEIAGCAGGTYDGILAAADILRGQSTGNGAFTLSIYPGSISAYAALAKNGTLTDLTMAGAIVRECFCGPCFGAGDCPANGEFSIRHTTRNFPNREGSKPDEGQLSAVALMDSRSIAATAIRGGVLTAATELEIDYSPVEYEFAPEIYEKRVYNGWGHPEPEHALRFGPNIKDWPPMPAMSEDMLVKICSYIDDPVTTTDELIPSGETSSYRSNPERLSEFALFKRDPQYAGRSKVLRGYDRDRIENGKVADEVLSVYQALKKAGLDCDPAHTNIGSTIFANMPGDGSAREQAASCQRVLGASANFAKQYATKRYRSNCINWGMVPFLVNYPELLELGDFIFVPGIREAIRENKEEIRAYCIKPDGRVLPFITSTGSLTRDERQIIMDGCLINYYREH